MVVEQIAAALAIGGQVVQEVAQVGYGEMGTGNAEFFTGDDVGVDLLFVMVEGQEKHGEMEVERFGDEVVAGGGDDGGGLTERVEEAGAGGRAKRDIGRQVGGTFVGKAEKGVVRKGGEDGQQFRQGLLDVAGGGEVDGDLSGDGGVEAAFDILTDDGGDDGDGVFGQRRVGDFEEGGGKTGASFGEKVAEAHAMFGGGERADVGDGITEKFALLVEGDEGGVEEIGQLGGYHVVVGDDEIGTGEFTLDEGAGVPEGGVIFGEVVAGVAGRGEEIQAVGGGVHDGDVDAG